MPDIAGLWKRGLKLAIQVVMPEVCAGCGISGHWICPNCMQKLQAIDPLACCDRCGYPTDKRRTRCRRCLEWPSIGLEVRSTYVFDGPVQKSIHRMKYNGEYARSEWHGEQLADLILAAGWERADMLVPVPLHSRKQRSRGFNQSVHLAKHCGIKLDIPVVEALIRTRNTPSQTGLPVQERATNVAGAFVADQSLAGKQIILIDDVLTTGSTLLACTTACLTAGATAVRAVTIATAVDP